MTTETPFLDFWRAYAKHRSNRGLAPPTIAEAATAYGRARIRARESQSWMDLRPYRPNEHSTLNKRQQGIA